MRKEPPASRPPESTTSTPFQIAVAHIDVADNVPIVSRMRTPTIAIRTPRVSAAIDAGRFASAACLAATLKLARTERGWGKEVPLGRGLSVSAARRTGEPHIRLKIDAINLALSWRWRW